MQVVGSRRRISRGGRCLPVKKRKLRRCSQRKLRDSRTSRFTVLSSISTWSKQLIGARKMIAFISSKNGTQAAENKQFLRPILTKTEATYLAVQCREKSDESPTSKEATRSTHQRSLATDVIYSPIMAHRVSFFITHQSEPKSNPKFIRTSLHCESIFCYPEGFESSFQDVICAWLK